MSSVVFRSLDIFKAPFLLRINGKEKISTFMGFIFSLGIISFLVIFFFNSDVFYHQRPTIIDQELFLQKKIKIDFNGENFGLVAALVDDPGNVYYDETIFSIKITQYVLNCSTHEVLDQDEKSVHFCDQNDYPDDPSILDTYGLWNYSCPSNKSFAVYGGWDESMINHFYVTISLCDNKTKNNTCKPLNQIQEFMADKYASISYKDSSYDLNNYENPVQNSYKNLWWTLSADVRKTATLFWKKVNINTDDGFVFRHISTTGSFQLDEKSLDVDLNYNQFIFQAEFYSSPKKEVAVRTYQKIQEVIASIGGLLSLFVSIGFILNGPQTRLNVIKTIMNNLYVFHKKKPGSGLHKSKFGLAEQKTTLFTEEEEKNEKTPQTSKSAKNILDIDFASKEKGQKKKKKTAGFNNYNNYEGPEKKRKESKNEVELSQFSQNREKIDHSLLKIGSHRKSNSCLENKNTPPKNSRNGSSSPKSIKEESILLEDFKTQSCQLKKKEAEVTMIKFEEVPKKTNINESIDSISLRAEIKKNSKETTIENSPNNRFEGSPKGNYGSLKSMTKLPSFTSKLSTIFSKFRMKTSNNVTEHKEVEKIIELEDAMNSHKAGFTFSIFEYFKYNVKMFFGCDLNFKEKLFKKTEKAFNKEVDLISILKRIHEIDKMKLLVLNQRQLTLFDLLSKPMIFVDEKKWRNSRKISKISLEDNPGFKMTNVMRQGRKAQKKNEEIIQCYEETLKQKNNNPIDERLMYFMEKKVEGRNLIKNTNR